MSMIDTRIQHFFIITSLIKSINPIDATIDTCKSFMKKNSKEQSEDSDISCDKLV